MKAWLLEDIGKLKYKDIPCPKPSVGEVIVNVKNCGICGSDIPRVFETGAHKMPLVIGHEFSGIVDDTVGEDCKWLGKRVGIFPLIPCMHCPSCLKKQYEMCENYDYLGSRRDGGFEEFVRVPVGNLILLQDEIDFEEAAMLEPMAVAHHAISRTELNHEDRILVYGLGTIGFMVLMVLKGLGYNDIYAVYNKSLQKETALKLGIENENLISSEEILNYDKKFNAVFECIGKNETFESGLSVLEKGGRLTLLGNPKNDFSLDKDLYSKILRHQLTIKGSWNSSYLHSRHDDYSSCISLICNGRVKPKEIISHHYALNLLEKGLKIMQSKSEEYIKVMVEI